MWLKRSGPSTVRCATKPNTWNASSRFRVSPCNEKKKRALLRAVALYYIHISRKFASALDVIADYTLMQHIPLGI